MDTLNNIRPGDRINISFSDSKVNKNNYKSSISDLISDDTWEITMPMESRSEEHTSELQSRI